MLKPGCVPAVIYWKHRDGHLTLAPFSDAPTPDDCIRYEADTLAEIDRIEKILQQQEQQVLDREHAYDEALYEPHRQAIRDRIYARITSSATTEYEKEFLKLYLELRDERKKALYRQRFHEWQGYMYARHFDLGDRDASKEEVNIEKINF